jgi:hypothetical protein
MRNSFLSISLILCFYAVSTDAASQDDLPYESIEWIQLMPEDDLEALLNPPELILGIEDGSAEDSLDSFKQNAFEDERALAFQQALTSTRVIESFQDEPILIPGYIVPLETNEQQLVTEFFIVPYFGACLHMPPPPPNQIIHAKHKQGVELVNLYDPFWFEGILKIELNEKMLGTSAYSLQLANVIKFMDGY